jgi:hypothetical protein
MLTYTDRIAYVVACPRCGLYAWKPRLEKEGCANCAALDSR